MKEKNFKCFYRCIPEEQRETLRILHVTRPYPTVNAGTTWIPPSERIYSGVGQFFRHVNL